MKKKSFIFVLCALCMSLIVPTQKVFAKEAVEDNKPIYISTVQKDNGRSILLGLCEERYKTIDSHEDIKFVTNPETGEQTEVRERVLICKDPGWARCRRTANGSKSTYRGVIISDDFWCSIENELLYDVDVEMMENHKYEGEKAKKVIVTNDKIQIVLLFVTEWKHGDSDGNGVIVTKVYDITNQIPSLF